MPVAKKITCRKCDRSFEKQDFLRHKKGPCDLICTVCAEEFKNFRSYDLHVKNAHETFTCPTCNKFFEKTSIRNARIAFERHKETRCGKPKPPSPYVCSGHSCTAGFENKKALFSHEGKCEYVVHKCEKCGDKFKNRTSKSRHRCTIIDIPTLA